jgi:hypothetical protein
MSAHPPSDRIALYLADQADAEGRIDTAAELRKLHGECEALREALKKANDQAEHFERHWYLRGDECEALAGALEIALVALEYHTKQTRPIERTSQAMTCIGQALAARTKDHP